MEPQRKRFFRRMLVLILVFIMLFVLRLTTLVGVSQGRSSLFPAQLPTPVNSPWCNVLPVENFAEPAYVEASINVLSVNQQGSFIATVPSGFLANGQTYAVIDAGKDILTSIKSGEDLQVALTLSSSSDLIALGMTQIDQKTYTACKSNVTFFNAQAKQISDQQVVYWENGSQVLSFNPTQFPVSVDKPVQVIVQFNENGSAVVLQAYNVSTAPTLLALHEHHFQRRD